MLLRCCHALREFADFDAFQDTLLADIRKHIRCAARQQRSMPARRCYADVDMRRLIRDACHAIRCYALLLLAAATLLFRCRLMPP